MDGDFWDWIKVGVSTGAGIGSAGSIFVGVLLFFRWMLNFIAGRTDVNQQRVDNIQKELIDDLRADVSTLKEENKEMRAELAECERRHTESDRKIIELEGMLQAAGIARQMAQNAIAADKFRERDQ